MLAVVILLVCFTVLVLTKPLSQDEGVFLTIGKYLNEGKLPYRDYFEHKPPAIELLLAVLFHLFGTNLFVAKAALITSALSASVLTAKISEELKRGSGWVATALILFLLTQFEGHFIAAESFLLVPLLLSFLLLLRKNQNVRWLFVAGFSLGLPILFKQTALLSVIPLLLLAVQLRGRALRMFCIGFVLPPLALGAYVFGQGIVNEAFHQIVELTLSNYPREPLSAVIGFLRVNFLWTLPVWVLLLSAFRQRFPNRTVLWALVLFPIPALLFRHYPHYWVQVLPFVAIITSIALCSVRRPYGQTVAVLVFCALVAGGKVAQDAVPNYRLLNEQIRVANGLRGKVPNQLLAENQFTGFYFLLPQAPLNTYLYITEITNAEGAEQQTINDLRGGGSTLILWPDDPNYAYAKELQKFILENARLEGIDAVLGMRILTYTPTTSQ